jgi:hypothetical protein
VDVPQLITGKSVLCAYLIRLLRSRGYTPAFFFFGHEKRAKPSVSTFLRTSAAHIASSNPAILEKIFNICARNPDLAEADAGKVWRKLFSDCILKHPSDQRYYWMIDGLDECKGERDLVGYIMQAARNEKFRIFVTSRTTPDSYEFLTRETKFVPTNRRGNNEFRHQAVLGPTRKAACNTRCKRCIQAGSRES